MWPSRRQGVTGFIQLIWFSLFALAMGASPAIAAQPPRQEPLEASPQESAGQLAPPDDWAAEVFRQDPLAAKEVVELEDLRRALQDEKQRGWVIQRHFARANLNELQRHQFLSEAFAHPDPAVRQQAAIELQRRGELTELVRRQLVEWIKSGDREAAETAIVALRALPLPEHEVDQELLETLIRSLESDSPAVVEAAARRLRELGPAAVPRLIEALQDPEQPRLPAAEVLSQILGQAFPSAMGEESALRPMEMAIAPPTESEAIKEPQAGKGPEEIVVKAAPGREPVELLERNVDEEHPETVRVYYGTNRALLQEPVKVQHVGLLWGAVCLLSLLALLWLMMHAKPAGASTPRWILRRLLLIALLIGVMLYGAGQINTALTASMSGRQGPQFSGRRSSNSTIHYGFCDVSIPPTHSVGEVERPLLGPEDERKHVILERVALLEEAAFYQAVSEALANVQADSRDCLLFIHGYNVSFDDAAMRAAQIHYDLKFPGTTMFYSWPSRASFRHYFSDRNEIQFSHRLIKQFLEGILENVEFDRFHVIAHSMGADALCQAIMELDPERKVFDQIILAAPDIDAEFFKSQVLPRLQQVDQRTTLYCSRNDLALHASKHFNDSLRAGDSSKGPLVAPGLDTIDATDMDTEMLGHSYYGNCLPLLDDLRLLIEQNRPPDQRKLEPLLDVTQLPYWIFID